MLIQDTNIQDIIYKITHHVKDDYVLISISENTSINLNEFINALNNHNIQFMGGIFPKVIHENTILDSGIVISRLKQVEKLEVIENIRSGDYIIPEMNFERGHDYSALTYVDGLTENISNYLNRLYENYGMKTNYIGGGAGSLSLEQKPCVFTSSGLYKDAAILCIQKVKSTIGVQHGWEKLNGPMIVTKAEKNTIREINWKSPFESYKTIIEHHSNHRFNNANFFDIAKGFPIGIVKNNGEFVIRDPLSKNDRDELVCIGEVEENALVHIMKGDANSLISGAKIAAEESVKPATNPQKALIIDCISRILYLEDDFDKELDAISTVIKSKFPNVSISGALTLGEISSFGNGYIELFNKTCVVGLFE